MEKKYFGSQEHFEDEIDAYYDRIEEMKQEYEREMNEKSNTTETAIDTNRMLTTDFNPINNPESVCFECTAGMCNECSSRHEWDLWRKNNSYLFEKEEYKKIEIPVKKKEFKCPKCGWTPNWNGRSMPKISDFYVGGGEYECKKCFFEFKFLHET